MEVFEDLKKAGVHSEIAEAVAKAVTRSVDSTMKSLVTPLQLGISLITTGTILVAIVWFVVGLQMDTKMGALVNKVERNSIKSDKIIELLKDAKKPSPSSGFNNN